MWPEILGMGSLICQIQYFINIFQNMVCLFSPTGPSPRIFEHAHIIDDNGGNRILTWVGSVQAAVGTGQQELMQVNSGKYKYKYKHKKNTNTNTNATTNANTNTNTDAAECGLLRQSSSLHHYLYHDIRL